jgi:hypothetical protein
VIGEHYEKLSEIILRKRKLVGGLETLHSIPYIVKGESNWVGMILGPSGIVLGGVMAGLYLKEAGVVY